MRLDRTLISKVIAEYIGTFSLAAVVLVLSQTIGQPFLTGIGAALVLATFVTTIGPISGAHINPAVTIGQVTLRKITALNGVAYLIFQFLGAFTATRVVEYMYGAKLPGSNATGKFEGKLFLAEAIGTFVFAWGIAAVVTRRVEGYQASAAIGTSLFIGIMLSAMTTGGGFVNPAVAFANKGLNLNTVFAPLVGSVVAMNLMNIISAEPAVAVAAAPTKTTKTTAKKTTRTTKSRRK